MQETFKEIIETMGGTVTDSYGGDDNWGIKRGGEIIHEVGATKMGDDPKTSVLNQFQQAHDVKNLFVVDGSGFASASAQNPTWTIMALSWRTADYITAQRKAGAL